jgi:Fe2+ or Zn2+ uptake regulation protein
MTVRLSTFQREVILEALQRSGRHVTAAELYQIVCHGVPRLSLGTVYRNLDILHCEGLVKKLGTAVSIPLLREGLPVGSVSGMVSSRALSGR